MCMHMLYAVNHNNAANSNSNSVIVIEVMVTTTSTSIIDQPSFLFNR
jgi:hypothetical protein